MKLDVVRGEWRDVVKLSLSLVVLLSLSIGCAVAFFLWSLDRVIELFWTYPWLLYLLPVSGGVSAWIYSKFGKDCEAGNNLIYLEIKHLLQIDRCSTPTNESRSNLLPADQDQSFDSVPARMSLLVLIGSLLTHVGGGSAGREGTALQIGGSIASWLSELLNCSNRWRAYALQAGLAAGFGAVFGTPLAATIFAIEVIGIRLFTWRSFMLSLPCALLADQVTTALGIKHLNFPLPIASIVTLNPKSIGAITMAAIAFGAATALFLLLVNWVKRLQARAIVPTILQPVVGGMAIILLTLAIGSDQYLSLGVKANPSKEHNCSLESSFTQKNGDRLNWLGKMTFTSVTLGSGFKGGEATPLFFMGATLGNALADPLDLPFELLAAIGFVAMFAAATKTPLACTLMAVELFELPLSTCILFAAFTIIACSIASAVRVILSPEPRQAAIANSPSK